MQASDEGAAGLGVEPGHFRDIGAADKGAGAGAGKHDGAQIVARRQRVEGRAQFIHRRRAHDVELGLIVERDAGDRAAGALVDFGKNGHVTKDT